MEWAEELKMSLRKTARKGRRSKSRDFLESSSTSNSRTVTSPSTGNKDLSIDITLDMHNSNLNSSNTHTPSSSNVDNITDGRMPPLRRVSGGWADTGLKNSKFNKRNSFDDDRFQNSNSSLNKSAVNSPIIDDIPVVPDLEEVKDEFLFNEIAEPPSVSVNRVDTLNELNSEDLLTQNAFSAMEDVDLSILTRCLQLQSSLDEPDEVWEWDKLFTEVTAEIHNETKDQGYKIKNDKISEGNQALILSPILLK